MEFLLLGPLEVRSAGERLPLGGPRQRAVLADLLLHAGSVVSMDGLIDDLWGAESPPTAEAVVQNAVSRLRRTLGREAIETRPPGYVLHAEPGAIDGRRFERLVRDATPLPPSERTAALRDALALWRGPPFADLAYESFLQDEIARLDELRLTALEDRLEAEIELGRHDAVVADAAALAVQHRSRERLCRLLMLSLHRAGRQQDALDAYEATRRALDELWGLEPSVETRALHLMILKQDPAIGVAPEPPQASGVVRRPVALLIVELLLDDELELEVAGSALGEARAALGDVAARHGGSLSPQSGVELVATFGAEGAREDDVLRAARTAVELREILRDREPDARLAVGTGRLLVEDGRPVLAGAVVGQTRRALHEAVGGEIVVTPAAARLAGAAIELDLDGRLQGVRPGRAHPLVEPAPFVGRSAELEALRHAFDEAVATKSPRHVVVVGEAGIGKTRLVAEALDGVGAVVLEASCVPYGEGITFLPLRDLAQRASAIDPDVPGLGDPSSADAAFAATRAMVEHFTATEPVVAVLDDAHWAVPTLLDLVEYLVRAARGPLLVVTATRPELIDRRPSWGQEAMTLGPFAGQEAHRLVETLPELEALNESLAMSIVEAAEGVPLFLEQLAAHAVESQLDRERMPPTLEALLVSRIDALEMGERELLSRAAVVGRTFTRESLGALTPDKERGELDGRLASLERGRLVRSRGLEHEFVHALVRDAAYEAIARPERARLHERFGRWLDERAEGDELVGTHFERAALDSLESGASVELSREAALRLRRAGARADARLDDWAALNLFERSAALLPPDDADRLETECMLGKSLKDLSQLPRAVALLESVSDRSRAAGNRRTQLRADVELVWPRLLDGSLSASAAGPLLDEAIAFFTEAGDDLGVARAEFAHSLRLGDFGHQADLAYEHVVKADAAYRRVGVEGQTFLPSVWLAAHGTAGVDDTIELCEQQFVRYPDHVRALASLGVMRAYLLALAGDLAESRASMARAQTELFELGMEVELKVISANVAGSIEAFAREWDTAGTIFDAALTYTRERGWTYYRAWGAYFVSRQAEVALGRDDPERAAQLASEAVKSLKVDDRLTRIWSRRVLGRALAVTGHPRKALAMARQAVELAQQSDDLVERGQAALDLADVLRQAGGLDAARDAAAAGIDLLHRKGASLLVENGRARFADLLVEADGGAQSDSSPADAPINS